MNRQFHSRCYRATPWAQRGGLSLIEVAIAMAIFVIGAVALLRIFPPGLTVIEDSGKRLIGSRMANSLLARYDGEKLPIPDAIYDARFDGGWKWNDYPGAMLNSRNKGQSLPRSVDRFDDSALGHLRFIRGEGHEIQGPFPAPNAGLVRVLSSFVVDRARADVYREGAVENVQITGNGELDFAGAIYKNTGRGARAISSLGGIVNGNGVSFREPIIELANTSQAENLIEGSAVNLILNLSDLTGVANRAAFYNGYVDQHRPQVSFSISAPVLKGALWGTGLPTDDFTATAPNGDTVQPNVAYSVSFGPDGQASIAINVADDVLPEADEYFYVHVFGARNCSVRQQRFLCRIPGNDGIAPGTPTDPTATPALVAVRPPVDLRATLAGSVVRPVVYLASYNWNNGGVRNEPLIFPPTDGDLDYPQSCDAWSSEGQRPGFVDRAYWNGAGGNPQILAGPITLRFRQFLGTQPVENGTSVTLTGLQVPDIYAPNNPGARAFPVAELQNIWIDYNAYDWRYLTESVTQFSTPFPGSAETYPQALAPIFGFTNTADLREVRLPVGDLLGPVYTINVYQTGSNQPKFDARTLDYRTVSDSAQRAALKRLFKEGRLLTSIRDSGPNAKFRFNAYYRTGDGWAQQIGVAASRYLPWRDSADYDSPLRKTQRRQFSEPWREYVLGADGKLYFHPSEAGKTVAVQFTVNGNYTQYTIDDDIIDRPAGIPAAFAPSGKVVATGNVGTTVFDVAAPDVAVASTDPATQTRGKLGMQGRVAWTNGDVYQQQFAP